MAPSGTPKVIVDKWNSVIAEMLLQADVKQKITESGGEIVGGTAKQMGDAYAADRNRLAPLIQKNNIKLD